MRSGLGCCDSSILLQTSNDVITLSATDVLAPTTMKNAAKCDTSCELQNPVSHQNFERILHFPLGSMPVGVSVIYNHEPGVSHALRRDSLSCFAAVYSDSKWAEPSGHHLLPKRGRTFSASEP